MKELVQGVINISEMCESDHNKLNNSANLILYRLLELHKKIFKDTNNHLWQPVIFPNEMHELNCRAVSYYLNGDLRAARKTWKNIIKGNPSYIYALYNLSILNPFKAD